MKMLHVMVIDDTRYFVHMPLPCPQKRLYKCQPSCLKMPLTIQEHAMPRPAPLLQHSSSSRRPQSPITPRTRMPTRPQQRPRLIQSIAPLPTDWNTLARPSTHTFRTPALPGCIRRRSSTTHTRRRSHRDRRRPTAHPTAYSSPMQMSTLEFPVVVDCDDDLVVRRVIQGSSSRLIIAKIHKLQAHSCVHE
jgi:hypothetical protein